MLFGRKNKTASPPIRPADSPSPVESPSNDTAKDTVAALLRTLAEYALPTTAFPADEFQERCEALAAAVLVRNALDESSGRPISEEKVHAEVRHTVRDQRRAESSEYSKHRESAHIIVSDLVTTLKRSLEQREGYDQEIVNLLGEMEKVVAEGDLNAIRRAATKTADHIRNVIAVQRERDKEQLEQLSSQLRGMREELADAQAQMQRDPLTELLNRGAFEDAFEKTVALSQASATDLTLFMVDLDHFKKVNDVYGHQAGDTVLKTVSKQLIRCFPRKDDMVVRFGGEEFAVLCRNTGVEEAPMLGERLRASIAGLEIDLEDLTYQPTASVGFAVLKGRESSKAFLKRADDALYAAKRSGRNRVEAALQPLE